MVSRLREKRENGHRRRRSCARVILDYRVVTVWTSSAAG
jgi:hypothetical protein